MFSKYEQHLMIRYPTHNPSTLEEELHLVYRNDKLRATVEVVLEDDWGGNWMPIRITASQDEAVNPHVTNDGRSHYGIIVFKRMATPCAPIALEEVEEFLEEYMNATLHST